MAIITSNGTGGGNSNTGASWSGGVVPTEGTDVQILNGDTITLNATHIWGSDSATPALDILSGGTLAWDNASSITLTLKGDFYVRSGGTLNLQGTSTLANVLTVKLNYSASLANEKYKFVAPTGSTVTIQGYNKTRVKDTLASGAASGQANIVTTNDNSVNWLVGDTIYITGIDDTTDIKEYRTISSISGTTITLTANLTNTYLAGGYVLNGTRNIVFTTYNATYYSYCSVQGTTNLDWAEFIELKHNIYYSGGVDTEFSTTAIIDIDYCSFHHAGTSPANKVAIWDNTTMSSLNFTENIFFNTTTNGGQGYSVRGTLPMIITNNYFINVGQGLPHNELNIGSSVANCFFEDCSNGIGTLLDVSVDDCIFKSCSSGAGMGSSVKATFTSCLFIFNTNGVSGTPATQLSFDTCSFGTGSRGNTTADITVSGYMNAFFKNSTFASTTPVSITSAALNGLKLRFENCTGVNTGHKTYLKYGNYELQTTIKYSGTSAVLMSPNNASYPLIATATVFAKSGETVAYSCYMRKSVSMATLPFVRLSGAGITTSTSTTVNTQDDWQPLTVSGVATQDGFCKIEFVCQNASGSVYVDDDQDSFKYWYEGDLPAVVPKPSMTANDIWNTQTAGLTAAGSVGKLIADQTTPVIADAVWDEVSSGHTTTGTFGRLLANLRNIMRFFQAIWS